MPNPLRDRFWATAVNSQPVASFHQGLPGYEPTPLLSCPGLAAGAELGSLHVKDESGRLGTRSFKILGCSWAVAATLRRRAAEAGLPASGGLAELGAELARDGTYLLTASAGNHGLALARVAAWCRLPCRVLLPQATPPAMVELMAREADVQIVAGDYDGAVQAARLLADSDHRALLVSDTSWLGYETIPGLVIEGYATLFEEIAATGLEFDFVAVQMGVGALAAATVRHFRAAPRPVTILGVEPSVAACVTASAVRGELSQLRDLPGSVMTGLDCGTPSLVAWPYLANGIDAFADIADDEAVTATDLLADVGLPAGPSGSAGVAGLLSACRDRAARERLGLSAATRALAILTEAAVPQARGATGDALAGDGSTDSGSTRQARKGAG